MATTKHEHDEPNNQPVRKTVLESGALVMPLAEPAAGDNIPRQTIGVNGEPIADAERDPGTIAEQQRILSARYEAEGFDLGRNQTAAAKAPPPLQHQPAHKDDHHTTKK